VVRLHDLCSDGEVLPNEEVKVRLGIDLRHIQHSEGKRRICQEVLQIIFSLSISAEPIPVSKSPRFSDFSHLWNQHHPCRIGHISPEIITAPTARYDVILRVAQRIVDAI
jgi:hypothetical protein